MNLNQSQRFSEALKKRYELGQVTVMLVAVFVLLVIVRLAPRIEQDVGARLLAQTPDELQVELGSGGFNPSEIQHAAGTFAIAVENSVIAGAYTLLLKAADGTVVKEIEVQKGSAAWTMTLQAGQYTLTETSHPEWLCRITIE